MRIHNLYCEANGESHWRDIDVEFVEQNEAGKLSARLPAAPTNPRPRPERSRSRRDDRGVLWEFPGFPRRCSGGGYVAGRP